MSDAVYKEPDREFDNIGACQRLLIGKKIVGISFTEDCDEGFTISCEDGVRLIFGFSGNEGKIVLLKKEERAGISEEDCGLTCTGETITYYELDAGRMNKKYFAGWNIIQIIPANGWVIRYKEYKDVPVIGWALVEEKEPEKERACFDGCSAASDDLVSRTVYAMYPDNTEANLEVDSVFSMSGDVALLTPDVAKSDGVIGFVKKEG